MLVHDRATEESQGVLESSRFLPAKLTGWSIPQHPLFEAERLPRAFFDDGLDDDDDGLDDEEDDDFDDDEDDDFDHDVA